MGRQHTRHATGTSCWEEVVLAVAGGKKEILVIVMAWNEWALTTSKLLSDACFYHLNWGSGRLKALLSRHYYFMPLHILLCSRAIVKRNQAINRPQLSVHGGPGPLNRSTSKQEHKYFKPKPKSKSAFSGLDAQIHVLIKKYRIVEMKGLASSSIKIFKYPPQISQPAWNFFVCRSITYKI